MNSQAWVSVAAIGAALLTTMGSLLFTRSTQARQIEAEKQRSITTIALEGRRAHEQRLWDARAKVYSDYLGWLQGSVREILRNPEQSILKGEIAGGWWKTPYELRTSMLLFESDAVRAERGTLAESLSAIVMVLDISRGDARQRPSVQDGLRREADEALAQIDVIIGTIRADMRAGLGESSADPNWIEELGELDARAKTESTRAVEAMRRAFSKKSTPESEDS
jgi:hypothetical protein